MEIWARLLVVQEWAGSLIILTSTALLTYLYWLQKCWNAQWHYCLLCLQEQQWTLPHPNTDTACLLMYKTCKTMKTMMLFSGNFHTMFMWYRGGFFFRPVTSSLSSSSSKFLRTHCSPWQDVPSFWLKALWKSPCWCKQNKTTTVLCLSNCVVFGIFCWFRIRNWKDLFLQQGASSKVSKDAI